MKTLSHRFSFIFISIFIISLTSCTSVRKEVKPELLKQHLQDIAELGGLLQRLGINVETMSNNV